MQAWEKEEAYPIFLKISSLMLERGDSDGVSKLETRVQQLFPNKTAFMQEAFAELIKIGKADVAVNGLQGLLRKNAKDKRVWDLIIDAYNRLEQKQKVRVAYHHYLKMLPEEPAPMLGLMFCSVADKDVKAVLELLDLYEQKLFSAGYLSDLQRLYRALDEIDPINIKVLQGSLRVAKAAGDEAEVAALSGKLKAISKVSGKNRLEHITPETESPSPVALDLFATSSIEVPAPLIDKPVQADNSNSAEPDTTVIDGVLSEPETIELDDLISTPDESIEIELEIDDADLEPPDGMIGADLLGNEDWLDSVGDLFDTITTSPSGVKYGSEMDSSDAQSHFDLGMAFREMGLYDEAINEFRKASLDSARRIACLIMQGACLRERGEFETAENMLNTLLQPGLNLDDACAVKYELVLTYESSGKSEKAKQLLNEIDSVNPHFRDVSTRLNAANLENSLYFSDDDLKNF